MSELLNRRRSFEYFYDWSNSYVWGWQHRISVEKTLPMFPGTQYPVCIAGGGSSPPEGCGHDWGYRRLLELRATSNPLETETKARDYVSRFKSGLLSHNHEETHTNLLTWLERFDPNKFDLGETNRALAQLSQLGYRYFRYLERGQFPPLSDYGEEG